MLRQKLKGIRIDSDFRWRSEEPTRLEGFSDAVFAFAITLLVVSLEVPGTFNELARTMSGFLAFGLSFTILVWFWFSHYLYFQRYGLMDGTTITLNSLLLFVVLFYIYPLKFLFGLLIDTWLGYSDFNDAIRGSQVRPLMLIYSLGFVAIFGIFYLLYLRAWKKREVLELNEVERIHTRAGMHAHLVHVGIGLLSAGLAASLPLGLVWIAGPVYGLIGPARAIQSTLDMRKIERLKEKSGD